MRALFIGGTGTISTAIVKKLSEDPAWEVYLLNRGTRSNVVPEGVKQIKVDIHDENAVLAALGRHCGTGQDWCIHVVADNQGTSVVRHQDLQRRTHHARPPTRRSARISLRRALRRKDIEYPLTKSLLRL